jgi:hypothetical protein
MVIPVLIMIKLQTLLDDGIPDEISSLIHHEMRGDVIEDNSVVSLGEGMDGSQQEFVCTRRGKIFMGLFE